MIPANTSVFINRIISIRDLADNGLDLGKRANRVETLPEFRRAGASAEVTEEVNVHLHGRESVRRRDVVVRVFPRKDVPELKKIPEVGAEIVVVGVSPERSELRSRRYAGCRSRRISRSRSRESYSGIFNIPLFDFDFAL